VNHVFNPNFFINVKYANYDTGFTLGNRDPQEGATLDFGNGVGLGGAWISEAIQRPLKNVTNVDGNYFVTGWGGQHELKFGFGYKKTPVTTETIYGGNDGLVVWDFGGSPTIHLYRQGLLSYEGQFFDAYLGDTFTKDRLTVNAGLRFDHQKSVNLGATVPGNKNFLDLLPNLQYPGGGTGINWNDISPRVGITLALDDSRKTVARASFAQYASKLDTGATTFDNPLGAAYLAYYWNDLNGDRLPQPNEVDFADGVQYYGGPFDPAHPDQAITVRQIDPNYKAPKDYEAIVGIDREVAPDFALSAAYTWRRSVDQRNWDQRTGFTSADYIAQAPVTKNGYTAQIFVPDPDLVSATSNGFIRGNRPDYHQSYSGIELSLIKRLSNKWMGRAAFSYMNWTEHLTGPGAAINPTSSDTAARGLSGPQVEGGQVAPRSSGSGKGDIFFGAKWQFSANALYQLPAGFEISTAVYGRQGFARPIVLQLSGGADGNVRVLATPTIDSVRYPNLWDVDLRLAKNMHLAGDANLTFSAELFNALNSNTELNRYRFAQSGSFNRLDEVLSPRIARFGVRLTF
jgi:hypothetical protein